MEEAGGELLVLLLDTGLLTPAGAAPGLPPDALLQQVLIFLRAHQLLSEDNHQCVIGLTPRSSPVLYTPASGGGGLAALLVERLAQLLELQPGAAAAPSGEAALSAGLSRALCYVRRHAARYAAGPRQRARPRVLTLAAGADTPLQYIAVMNAIFAAQACGIVLDACVLGGADSAFLQQAAHLTGGTYLRPGQPAGLLQHLLGAFAADTATRAALSGPSSSQVVDYRASCFCHKTIIDTGYICSVCLSIFCKANMKATECPTCGSPFKQSRGGGGGGAPAGAAGGAATAGAAGGAAAGGAGAAGG